MESTSSRRDVLAIQYLERLLERRYLLLSPGDSVLVAHARVDALRLELLVVLERGGEFLLRAAKVGLFLLKALLVVLFLG
jgi:hypothetical protein